VCETLRQRLASDKTAFLAKQVVVGEGSRCVTRRRAAQLAALACGSPSISNVRSVRASIELVRVIHGSQDLDQAWRATAKRVQLWQLSIGAVLLATGIMHRIDGRAEISPLNPRSRIPPARLKINPSKFS
jgi:hypothetical protein